MADKIISIKLILDKEKEFKSSLQQIGSEMKLLTAEAKKLQAQYAEEANTYEALAAKSKNLGAQYDELTKKLETQKKALENQRELKKQYEAQTESLKKEVEEATAAYKNAAEKTEDLEKAMRKAKDAVNQNAQNIEKAESSAKRYERQITETETAQILLGRELDKTSKYLQEAATSADGTAHSIDKYGNEVKDAAEDTKSFANAADLLAQAIVASGAVEGAEKLRDAIVDTAKASIEYESAFAGVRKTVDGTAEELAAISDGIKGMATEIPIATTELAGIAEAAGQLGIETGSILGFTEVMAQLGVTTNLSSTEAAESLAKFANITKMSESQYSNLGSSIVALGNNFATTEADIVAMATRLASTGEVVGLTEPQILAVATALSSVGIEAEAGGSAFSKLLKTIETAVESGSESVEEYARIAGKSAEEFSAAWREDAVSALSDFIDGLGRLEGSGTSAITVLNDLGLNEERLSNAVLALASSEGILTEALALSNSAWEENTALANEAAIRFETTESKLQILNNTFNNLKITVGDELLDKFGGAIDGLTDLTQAADEYVKKNPDVVAGITAVAAGLGSLAVAGTVIPLITTLWGLLSANPVGLATAGILALAAASTTYYIASSDATDAVSTFNRSLQETASQIDTTRESVIALKNAHDEETSAIQAEQSEIESAIQKIEELGNKTDLTASESEILKQSMDKLNGSIPGLRLSYDNLNDSLEDTVYHLRLVASAQALVDEAVAKSDLRDSLEGNFEQLDKDVENAKKSLDDANTLLDRYIKLRDEYTAPAATGSGRARGMGSTYNPYDEDVKRLEKAVEDANALFGMAIGAREANKRKIYEIDAEIASLDSQYAEKAEEIKNTTTDLFTSTETGATTAAEAVEEASDKIAVSTEKIGKSAASTKVTVDEAGKAIITHADTVKKNLETLTKEYDSAYKSAQSSLGGIGGLFGEVAFKTDKSISDMLSGLDSQADYFTGYMLNLQRASQIGIDEGLVAALADGSDESAGYLQKIIDEFNKVAVKYGENSEEAEAFVTDFNTKFEATSKAKDALAATMAGIQTNFEERAGDILAQADDLITELSGYSGNAYDEVSKAVSETLTDIADGFTKFQVAAQEKSQGIIDAANYIKTGINTTLEVLPEEMKVAGQNVSLGLSEGILDKAGVLEDTVRRLAKEAIIGAAKDELGIRSPAKEGEQIGKFFDEGIAQGIERNESTVISANLKMISDLESASQSAAAAAGTALGNTIAESMAAALQAGQALREAAESGNLTVNGNKVQTAAQAGIPSLSGQAAEDWLNEVKAMFGLPDSYTNQDAVDFLNGGGAMLGGSSSGLSSTTKANIESAVKNERTSQNSITRVKVGNRYINISDPGGLRSSYGIGGGTVNYGNSKPAVVVNQTFTGTTSAHQVKKAAEEGVKNAVYK